MSAWARSAVEVTAFLRDGRGGFVSLADVAAGSGPHRRFEGRIDITVDGLQLLPPDVWFDIDWLGPFLVRPLEECRRTGEGTGTVDGQPPLTLRIERVPRTPLVRLTVSGFGLDDRSLVGHEADVVAEIARGGLALVAELERLGGTRALDPEAIATLTAWST